MAEASSPVMVAAALFGLDAAQLRPLGGNSASAWDAGGQVLRLGRRPQMEIEAAAAAAAAAVVPVPEILDRADFGDMTAVRLERLPGHDVGRVASQSPALARAVGRACGAVHARLATVPATARLPPVLAAGNCAKQLVHLDLHPFNILVNNAAEITGVLDWANARAGDPAADRARTWAILNLDPAARARRGQPGWRALTDGWTESGALDALPAAARAWACRFMLADLATRYPAADLAHVRLALHQAETDAKQ